MLRRMIAIMTVGVFAFSFSTAVGQVYNDPITQIHAETMLIGVLEIADLETEKLGGIAFPYYGEGGFAYDFERSELLVTIETPEGIDCQSGEIGWAFRIDPPENLEPEAGFHWFNGLLEAELVEGFAVLTVHTDEGLTQEIVFEYTDEIPDFSITVRQEGGISVVTNRLVNNVGSHVYTLTFGAQLVDATQTASSEPTNEVVWPGGHCECYGKCQVGCGEGFHAHCDCRGEGKCVCYKNAIKKKDLESHLAVSLGDDIFLVPGDLVAKILPQDELQIELADDSTP